MKLTEILSGPEHWCQDHAMQLTDGVMQVCLSGAFRLRATGVSIHAGARAVEVGINMDFSPEDLRRLAILADVVCEQQGMDRPTNNPSFDEGVVVHYNDRKGRTFAEIQAVCAETDRRWMLAGLTD